MNQPQMYSDPLDQGQHITELFTEAALANKRPEAPKEATGRCLSCNSELDPPTNPNDPPRRWCDRYCTSEWEKDNEH